MFWKFNYMTSEIDTLLDKEDVTLKDILDEDDVLQECKAQNKKLVDFLVKKENFEELMNHVINEPSSDVEEKARYKYANITCELITSDVNQITEALATTDGLLDKVIGYLDSDAPLNPLQASFFSKVIGLLITRKSELILGRLKSKENFVERVLHHIGTSAVMDLLLRLITSMESLEARSACIEWLLKEKIVSRLVDLLSASSDSEVCCNASQSLCDMIRLSREQTDGQSSDQNHLAPLLQAIEHKETVTQILDVMFKGENHSEASLTNSIYVLQTLIEFRRVGPEGLLDQPLTVLIDECDGESSDSADGNNDKKASANANITDIVETLVPRLKDFHNVLLNPPKQYYQPMPTTYGILNKPLGNTRLQTVRLIGSAISTNTLTFNIELAKLNTISVLLDLYFEYSWNNFLHAQVERCIQLIVNVENSTDRILLTQLIKQTSLLEKIMSGFKTAEDAPPGVLPPPPGVVGSGCCKQVGYMGHLTKIANTLSGNDKNFNCEKFEELLKGLSSDVQENWNKFVLGSLAEVNKLNVTDMMTGGTGFGSTGGDEDEFSIQIPFSHDGPGSMQKVGRTVRLFGINEDEFNDDDDTRLQFDRTEPLSLSPTSGACDSESSQEMFERLCSARDELMRTTGSAEEDVWMEKELTLSDTAAAPSSTSPRSRQMPGARGSTHMALDSDEDSDGEGVDGAGVKDNSSDSEEDLDSPATIRQTPDTANQIKSATVSGNPVTANNPFSSTNTQVTTAESMDTGDNWANFDEAAMDTTEGTTAPGWSSTTTAQPSAPSASAVDGNWADFGSFGQQTTSSAVDPSETSAGSGWADFSDLSRTTAPTDSELTDISNAQGSGLEATASSSSNQTTSPRAAAYVVSMSTESLNSRNQ